MKRGVFRGSTELSPSLQSAAAALIDLFQDMFPFQAPSSDETRLLVLVFNTLSPFPSCPISKPPHKRADGKEMAQEENFLPKYQRVRDLCQKAEYQTSCQQPGQVGWAAGSSTIKIKDQSRLYLSLRCRCTNAWFVQNDNVQSYNKKITRFEAINPNRCITRQGKRDAGESTGCTALRLSPSRVEKGVPEPDMPNAMRSDCPLISHQSVCFNPSECAEHA